ncbi:MAG: iron-containing alcohol dehydrogenase [Streptococcaceae bacterium]|nr:iron-containing alcohol dehydrogenase [Streptococcaceae bacterium]
MENFRMYVPTDIRFGKNRLDELPESLAQFGKRVLLVYGGGSIKKSGLYQQVIDLLNANDFYIQELSGIEPNPRIESVNEGASLIKEHNLEVILAVGGGSVVDAAKVMAGAAYYDGDAWDLIVNKELMYDRKALPLVDILTLAATGTEMNRNAVISNLAINEKKGTWGWNLIPQVSFLDPTTTYTVNKWQTAAGVADTLSHLFEQYFNRTTGVELQDNIAEGIMKTVIKYGPIAIVQPEDYDARSNLLWASTLALNGLTSDGKAGGWSCHTIEHKLSAYYDITHGTGLAIITPRWMKHCIDTDSSTHEKFAIWAKNVFDIHEKTNELTARKGVETLYNFFKQEMLIPMTLQETGIPDTKDVLAMSSEAVNHGGLNTNRIFVPMEIEDVEKILLESFVEMSEF